MIPRHNPAVSRNLPCADLDPGQYSYWTKGKRVYFDGNEVDFGKVLVDLVVASPDNIVIGVTKGVVYVFNPLGANVKVTDPFGTVQQI